MLSFPRTPVQGLGCMSGSYDLYGLAATIVWILLLSSAWMSQYYASYLSSRHDTPQTSLGRTLRILIPPTRHSGKILATINFIWLLALSFLEFTNVFDNCWCASCALGLRDKVWVILWASKDDMVAAARPGLDWCSDAWSVDNDYSWNILPDWERGEIINFC